jgi:hypothetical protein
MRLCRRRFVLRLTGGLELAQSSSVRRVRHSFDLAVLVDQFRGKRKHCSLSSPGVIQAVGLALISAPGNRGITQYFSADAAMAWLMVEFH